MKKGRRIIGNLIPGLIASIAKKALGVDGTQIWLDPAQWDDLSGALFAARLDLVTGRLDYDPFNAGVKVQANARYPDEPMVVPLQLKHAMIYGVDAIARPHFHWLQEQAAIPNFMLAHKLTLYGAPTVKEIDFTNYLLTKWDANLWSYPGGVFAQITKFPEIDLSGATISASLDTVLFRDSANASGLFAGVDPVATDVIVKYNDSHIKFNSAGSRQEFVK